MYQGRGVYQEKELQSTSTSTTYLYSRQRTYIYLSAIEALYYRKLQPCIYQEGYYTKDNPTDKIATLDQARLRIQILQKPQAFVRPKLVDCSQQSCLTLTVLSTVGPGKYTEYTDCKKNLLAWKYQKLLKKLYNTGIPVARQPAGCKYLYNQGSRVLCNLVQYSPVL
jgi:hypothetical protein